MTENPVNDYKPIADFFHDESILYIETEEEYPSWWMYFEGAVNVHGNGVGTVVIASRSSFFGGHKLEIFQYQQYHGV